MTLPPLALSRFRVLDLTRARAGPTAAGSSRTSGRTSSRSRSGRGKISASAGRATGRTSRICTATSEVSP